MSEQNNPQINGNDCSGDADRIPEDLDEYLDGLFSGQTDFISRDKIVELLDSINSRLGRLAGQLQQTAESHQDQTRKLQSYLSIVAECQKQTASIANHELERHLLHPAIQAVDVLTGQIKRLLEQATALPENEFFCPYLRPIVDSIKQTAQIADAKCRSLDIETIEPKEMDEFDAEKHEVKQAISTDDSSKHRRTKRTLVAGLLYRGKVLRQAKVSVYRHRKQD